MLGFCPRICNFKEILQFLIFVDRDKQQTAKEVQQSKLYNQVRRKYGCTIEVNLKIKKGKSNGHNLKTNLNNGKGYSVSIVIIL